jgi:Peptidase family S41
MAWHHQSGGSSTSQIRNTDCRLGFEANSAATNATSRHKPIKGQAVINRRAFLGRGASLAVATSAIIPTTATASSKSVSDIALVREILTTLHPGLYRYNSPKNIDGELDRLEQQWVQQPALAARYLNLSRFLATIKCGHSYANFFNQSKSVTDELFDRKSRLPFSFKWIGEQMVVLQDQSGTGSLPRGTLVKAINGVRVKDMLARLLPYSRADGNNNGKRRALLSVSGADQIETFDVFHGLIYGTSSSDGREPRRGYHRVRVRLPGKMNDEEIDLPALTLLQRQSFITARDYRGDSPVWEWTMRDDGIAVLKMDGWAMYNSKWAWEAWLNDRLDSLTGAKGLIVDIRENEGGNDCGDVILSRLAGKDIMRPAGKRLVRYRKVPAHLNPFLDTWDNSFRDWGDGVRPYNDRFFEQVGGIADPVIPAKAPRIDVPMAVLTSAQNSSATFQFAQLCKSTALGTLVGETTGGNRRGINGGAFFFARLPESGIEFDVPLIGYFPDAPQPDAGVEPDIRVAMTAAAIASGTDPQMTAAISHLLRK